MHPKIAILLAAFAASAVLATAALPVQAQSPTAPRTAPGQSAPDQIGKPINISDEKLEAAAAAVKKVAALGEKYEQQLAQAPEEKKDGVVREANDELAKAVTEQGLSVEEFSMIMEVAKNDPAVREKIVQRIK
jgi:hypothetical protein